MNEREKQKWYLLEEKKVKAISEINVGLEILIRLLESKFSQK